MHLVEHEKERRFRCLCISNRVTPAASGFRKEAWIWFLCKGGPAAARTHPPAGPHGLDQMGRQRLSMSGGHQDDCVLLQAVGQGAGFGETRGPPPSPTTCPASGSPPPPAVLSPESERKSEMLSAIPAPVQKTWAAVRIPLRGCGSSRCTCLVQALFAVLYVHRTGADAPQAHIRAMPIRL